MQQYLVTASQRLWEEKESFKPEHEQSRAQTCDTGEAVKMQELTRKSITGQGTSLCLLFKKKFPL